MTLTDFYMMKCGGYYTDQDTIAKGDDKSNLYVRHKVHGDKKRGQNIYRDTSERLMYARTDGNNLTRN